MRVCFPEHSPPHERMSVSSQQVGAAIAAMASQDDDIMTDSQADR